MQTNKIVEITESEVDFLRALPGQFEYKPTKTDDEGNVVVNTESPLYGKHYRRFAYNDKVFVVNTEDEFCSLYDEDNLWTVRFSVNEEGQYSLVKGISINRAIKTAKTSSTIKKIYRDVELSEVDADFMGEFVKD